MTDAAFKDCIAIDTNVFIHLFDPVWNTDSHINKLLEHFQPQGIEPTFPISTLQGLP